MENLIECRITKKHLKILNDTFCVYKNGTKKGEIPFDCGKCILWDIQYVAAYKDVIMTNEFGEKRILAENKPIIRDLCFAIYHDKVLTKNPKYLHH